MFTSWKKKYDILQIKRIAFTCSKKWKSLIAQRPVFLYKVTVIYLIKWFTTAVKKEFKRLIC